MANHNELKKISSVHQSNTVVYSDENGYISDWLNNDPVIAALKQQTEFIGTIPTLMVGEIATIPEGEDMQTVLTQFVYDTLERLPQVYDEVYIVDVQSTCIYYNNQWSPRTGSILQTILTDYVEVTASRQPRNGDEVAFEADGDLWLYNGTSWVYFSNTTLKDATYTTKGVVQIGSGLNVNNGLISVDGTLYTPVRNLVNNSETTPSLALEANTDYVFTNALTSLTLTTIPVSQYSTDLYFTTGNSFTFSATNLTQYYFSDNPPTFNTNTTYKIHITEGKAQISYIGARVYPINKITATNPTLTPVNNVATWTITNTLGTKNIILRVFETISNDTVDMDSNVSASTITLKFYSETNVSADTYTLVAIG